MFSCLLIIFCVLCLFGVKEHWWHDEKRLCPGGYSLFDRDKEEKIFFFVRSSRHYETWNVILFLN